MVDGRVTAPVPGDLDGERLDKVLAVVGEMSRSAARSLIDAGEVTLDGDRGTPRQRVAAGQEIAFPPPAEPTGLVPEPVGFEVVHEDEHLVVIGKPPGVVVHPGAGRTTGTLAAGILHRYPQVQGVGEEGRWGIVHRLDRDTSGLMVAALSQDGYDGLVTQIRAHTVGRVYLALVDGQFEVPTGTIDAPIARDPARPGHRRVDPSGRPSRTHYTLEAAFPGPDVSFLKITLETGRTHQIRVHMAAIDHPLVGDPIYRSRPNRVDTPRQFLHSHQLELKHPLTAEAMAFESGLPPDLGGVLDDLETAAS